MTLSTTQSRANYPGAGSVGPFAIPFRFTNATDLVVTKRSSAGVETTLVNVTDFTTTGAGNATGTLTLTVALAAGETLSIRRAPPMTQATSIRNQGPYHPATIEDAYDRLVMQLQSLQDQVERSFALTESYDPAAVTTKLKPETGKALVWQSLTQLGNSTLDANAAALPGEGRSVASLTAYLLNNRVFNPLDYGAVGNGAADDFAALDETFTRARAAGGRPVDMGDHTYLITAALDVSNAPVYGNPTLLPSGFITEAVTAAGSLGAYENLDSNAVRGENRIVSATLAGLVTTALALGPVVVRITSSADFTTAEVGIKQSEMKSVRNVIGSTIYFDEELLDSYTTANTAKAAIVTLAQVDVRGKLTVRHSPAASDTKTRGVKFNYAQVRGYFDLFGCRGNGAAFINCWRCDARVDTQDATATGAGVTAYGISIQDATCYSYFRGVISGTRAATDCSGVNDATGGVPWENHVTVHSHLTAATALFNAHSNCGSIYWEDCVAEGGSGIYDLAGTLLAQGGAFSSGARRTYIRNATVHRLQGASLRSESGGASAREEFVVDGLHLIDCPRAFTKGANTAHLDRLVVRNVTGTLSDLETAALTFLTGDIDEWIFESIHPTGGGLLEIATDVVDTPDTITINGFTCKGDGSTVDIDIRGVYIAADTAATASVKRLRLWNGTIDGMYYGIFVGENLDLLELVNVELVRNLQHIVPAPGVVIGQFKWHSGSARLSRHGSGTQGVVSGADAQAITIADVDGLSIDTDPYLLGAADVSRKVAIGRLITHAGFLGYVRSPNAAYRELLSGSWERPRMLRGAGSPEAVDTGYKGCLFERSDGGAGTCLYAFEGTDGANTGWAAK